MRCRVLTLARVASLGALALLALDALAAPKSYKCDPGTAKVGVGCECPKGLAPTVDDKGVARCLTELGSPKKDAPSFGGKPAPSDCPSGMVGIPGGRYKLAVRRDDVEVAPFCLDATEVTVLAIEACVDGKACREPTAYAATLAETFCNWKHPSRRAKHPVNCVDWSQATAYCAFVGRRLPTEEEWEWAARSGDKGWKYPWGDSAPTEERANACGKECPPNVKAKIGFAMPAHLDGDDAFPETAPVGSFPKGDNRWGVHDLSGNVAELTSSKFETGGSDRVERGGSWFHFEAQGLSAGARERVAPTSNGMGIGFRCAKTP